MSLTDVEARKAKPKERAYKLADGLGLYLWVGSSGSKLWRYKYRYHGKEKLLSLGSYPAVSVAKARKLSGEARVALAENIDPMTERRQAKLQKRNAAGNSFRAVAQEWLSKQRWSKPTRDKAEWTFEKLLFPWLGERPIAEITAPEVLGVLRRTESRGKLETAQRAKQRCSQVFRYGIATGLCERDPAADLKGALATPKTQHRASITEAGQVGALMRAIHSFEGSFVVASALKLLPFVFVRPGELRSAEWKEIDLDNVEWRIPAERMKMRAVHIVPLSEQAAAILRELHPLTGNGRYVFPSVRSRRRPMSENTINSALRRLGYTSEQMTAHGFRSLASTLLHERGYNPDWIERQLAHAESNKVRAAYNYAEHLHERRRMMQEWADYLDVLREQRKVVAGGFRRA